MRVCVREYTRGECAIKVQRNKGDAITNLLKDKYDIFNRCISMLVRVKLSGLESWILLPQNSGTVDHKTYIQILIVRLALPALVKQ